MEQKLAQSSKHRYLKKPKTEAKNDNLKRLENSLLALKAFGDITTEIPLEVPTNKDKLAELELIFNSEHEVSLSPEDLEKEAKSLLKRYQAEENKQKIEELNAKLEALDENDAEFEEVIRQIRDLQNSKN